MTLYHASTSVIELPDIIHSRDRLDFGKGFYVTVIREQAEKYAERFLRRGKEAYLNVYETRGDLSCFKKKEFASYNEEWLDYVMNCRQGLPVEPFDWIVGGIADDKVFNTIDLYFANVISKDEALRRLVYEKPNQQICITCSKLLSENLFFKEAIKLPLENVSK